MTTKPENSGGLAITRGNIGDAAELSVFAAQTFRDTFSADNNPQDLQAHLEKNYGPVQQRAELENPDIATILVRSDGELVAYAQVRKSTPPACVDASSSVELHRFYVARKAHGTGLASLLMDEVHRAARGFAGGHIWLGVWENNPRAIAFYTKAGFVDTGSHVFMVGPDKQIDRVMVARTRSGNTRETQAD